MARIRGDILIGRSPEAVFDFVADERNEPRFNPQMATSSLESGEPIGEGSRFRTTFRSVGRLVPMTVEFTGYERPHRLGSRTRTRAMLTEGELTFEPEGSGTRMRWSWDVQMRGPLRLAALLVARMGDSQERRIWGNLKALLEEEEPGGAEPGTRPERPGRNRPPRADRGSLVSRSTPERRRPSFRETVTTAERQLASRPRRHLDDPRLGRIEYADEGSGPVVLVSHPLFGGFDVGLGTGHLYLDDGFHLIAPSRFGYLGSSLPKDATPDDQIDAFARLLDAIGVERAALFGYSAGGPPAMRFALRHPDRTTCLVLLASAFPGPARKPPRPLAELLYGSDLFFWAFKRASPTAFSRMLGMPKGFRPTEGEQETLNSVALSLFPMAARKKGALFDTYVSTPAVQGMTLEDVQASTLVINAADDGLSSYENAVAGAARIPNARFVRFDSGGHLLLGHEAAVREKTSRFIAAHPQDALAKDTP